MIFRSALSIFVVFGIVMIVGSGCSDSNLPSAPVAAAEIDVEINESGPTVATEPIAPVPRRRRVRAINTMKPPREVYSQEESKQETEPEKSILGTASQLFEQAKSKSGETAFGATAWVQDKLNGAAEAGSQSADDSMKWANETYESLKAQGLTTAQSTSEWLGQDYDNMESWEYKVITLPGSDEELALKLNEFGKQGWNCFNTESRNEGVRFYLKKQTFSYMRHLPFKDIIKLVPMMGSEEKK